MNSKVHNIVTTPGKKKILAIDAGGTRGVISVEILAIREFELRLLKDSAFQQRLGSFNRWEQESSPAETDLKCGPVSGCLISSTDLETRYSYLVTRSTDLRSGSAGV